MGRDDNLSRMNHLDPKQLKLRSDPYKSEELMPFAPVTVLNEQAQNPTVIRSIEEAAEFVMFDWPIVPGGLISSARQACLDALRGKVEDGIARDFLIAAAKEARIFIGTA